MVIVPSPSSLRSATSPKGRGKGASHGCAVISHLSQQKRQGDSYDRAVIGHLSQRERQGRLIRSCCGCPLRPRCARPPLPKTEARGARLHDRAVVALSVLALLGHLSQRERQGVLHTIALRSATSPKGRGKGASHGCAVISHLFQQKRQGGFTRLRFARPPLPKGEAREAHTIVLWLPSPSSLRSATSPKGRGKGCFTRSRFARPPLPKTEARDAHMIAL